MAELEPSNPQTMFLVDNGRFVIPDKPQFGEEVPVGNGSEDSKEDTGNNTAKSVTPSQQKSFDSGWREFEGRAAATLPPGDRD